MQGFGFFSRGLWIGLVLALSFTAGFPAQQARAQAEPAATLKTKLFLAVIGFEPQVVEASCPLTALATEFANLMSADQNQQRSTLVCNAKLAAVAQARAQDMADRAYFSHVTPDGYGPNYLVRSAGYPLPTFYSQANDGNNIESIAAGYASAAEAWAALKASDGHRRHLLGEEQFYAEQIEYGIGYVHNEQSTFKDYWVIITAKQAPATE